MAGTLVWTSRGRRAIEDVEPGDLVLSIDSDTERVVFSVVESTFVRTNVPVFELVVVDSLGREEVVRTTAEHPFWSQAA